VNFLFIAVEQIHGFKRNDPAVLMNDMHTAFLDGPYVEIIGVNESHDDNTKEIVIVQPWRIDFWNATHQLFEILFYPVDRNSRTEYFQEVLVKFGILFVDNCIATVVKQVSRINISRHWKNLAIQF